MSGLHLRADGAQANIRLDAALGGGALWDVGCYPVSYAQLLAGHEPNDGVRHRALGTPAGVDEEFMGMLRFDSGMTANVYASFRAAYRTWLEVLGSDGALTVPNPFRPGPLETLELERGGAVERIDVAGSAGIFVSEVEDFERAVLDGAPPVVSLAESRRTAATLSRSARVREPTQDRCRVRSRARTVTRTARSDGAVAARTRGEAMYAQ